MMAPNYTLMGCSSIERFAYCHNVSAALVRWYAATPVGPRSTLHNDVTLDFVIGRNQEAAEQYADALRESLKDRLATSLGRRKGRDLELEALKRLPPSDLAEACRLARLQPSNDAAAMAAALHALLYPRGGITADRAASTVAATASPQQGPRFRQASWKDFETKPGIAAMALSLPSSVPAPSATTGHAVLSGGAVDDDEAEAAAEAALLAAAEREVDKLFDEDLQRRLQQATAAAGGGGGRPAGDTAATVVQPPSPVISTNGAAAATEYGTQHSISAAKIASASQPLADSRFATTTSIWDHDNRPPPAAILRPPPSPHHQPPQPSHPPWGPQWHELAQQADGPGGMGPGRRHLFPQEALEQRQQQQQSGGGGRLEQAATGSLVGAGPGSGGGVGASGSTGGVAYGFAWGAAQPLDPSEVFRAVRRCLVRMGYGNKDPRELRSLLLLSRRDLLGLVRDFCGDGGGVDLSPLALEPGGLLCREQLAMRLRQLMGCEPAPAAAGEHGGAERSAPGVLQGPAGLVPEQADMPLSSAAPSTAAAAATPRAAVPGKTAPQVASQQADAEAGNVQLQLERSGDGGAGLEAASQVDLGDPRRREVLQAAAQRRRLLADAARPEEIATWLVKARAQDVLLIQWDVAGPEASSSVAAGAAAEAAVVIATGLSQRHAFACAEAVRYQIRERLEELATGAAVAEERAKTAPAPTAAAAAGGPAAVPRRHPPHRRLAVPGPPAVSGVNGGDWLSLEAGAVQVHVLTQQARQYYRLEEAFTGSRGGGSGFVGDTTRGGGSVGGVGRSGDGGSSAGGGGRAVRVRVFGPEVGAGQQPETLETARIEQRS